MTSGHQTLLCLCDLILMMVLGGGCYHPCLKGWRSEKLHYLPKSCSLTAGIQRLASLIANSCLGSRNMPGNQSRSKWTPSPLWEQGSTAVVQGWSEWPPGLKVHAAGRYRTSLPFCEGSFSPPWKANPKGLILSVSISHSAHATFLSSLEGNQCCFPQSGFSCYPE